jgi:uncharacterized protein (TIGR02996 family)
MGDGDEFLRAILAAPEEDAPRLAYADWLAQRGNPFGEFIRVQCRLAHTDSEDSLYPSLRDKEQYLFAHHAAGWLDEAVARLLFGEQYDPNDVWALPDFEREDMAYRFVRGWLDWLCLVWMMPAYPHWRELLAAAFHAPSCGLLRVFESWYVDDDERWERPAGPVSDPLEVLAAGPSLLQIRVLKLGGPESDYIAGKPRQTAAVLPALLERLPDLQELHLNAFNVDYKEALVSGRLSSLRRLRLTCACANDAACAALAASGIPKQLEILEIAFAAEGQLTEAGIRDLVVGLKTSQLRRLDLSQNHWLDPARVTALVQSAAQEVIVMPQAPGMSGQ